MKLTELSFSYTLNPDMFKYISYKFSPESNPSASKEETIDLLRSNYNSLENLVDSLFLVSKKSTKGEVGRISDNFVNFGYLYSLKKYSFEKIELEYNVYLGGSDNVKEVNIRLESSHYPQEQLLALYDTILLLEWIKVMPETKSSIKKIKLLRNGCRNELLEIIA